MKKNQIAMLGAVLVGLAVLVFFERKEQSVPEHQPGVIQFQEQSKVLPFEAVRNTLTDGDFPCDDVSISYQSDCELRLRGTILAETLRRYLPETEVGYNALLGLLPEKCSCVLDFSLAAEGGTLCVWCTGAELEGICLPEAMIPQIVAEQLAGIIWPTEGLEQLEEVRVTEQGIALSGQ